MTEYGVFAADGMPYFMRRGKTSKYLVYKTKAAAIKRAKRVSVAARGNRKKPVKVFVYEVSGYDIDGNPVKKPRSKIATVME